MDNKFLLDLISDDEYLMLEDWRDQYAWSEGSDLCGEKVSIRSILSASWAKNNETLYYLLGDNLVIAKEFSYEKSSDELVTEFVETMGEEWRGYGRAERKGWQFLNNYRNWYMDTFEIPSSDWSMELCRYVYQSEEEEELARRNADIRNGLCNLISYWTLAENSYDGDPFTIELAEGKKYTVSKGCKPMKAISKIAEAYNIEGFEDFRICHSLVLNQKKVKGTIHLSIHPLDYWTMSDNNCGWDSCMSWSNYGGYRQGTVEMMNSPCVVVAYISSSEPMNMGGDREWNSKKWRQLFIVDRNLILGIKSYPYFNEAITSTVINWLKELAETNMGWKYFGDSETGEAIKYELTGLTNPAYPEDEFKIRFNFCSNNMYTDVGCMDYHPLYVGTHIWSGDEWVAKRGYKTSSTDEDGKRHVVVEYNYSGESQCMSCGEIEPDLDTESNLCCNNCEDYLRCEDCGTHIYDGEYSCIDGIRLCNYCYDERVSSCSYCEEDHLFENMTELRLSIPMSDEYKEKMKIRTDSEYKTLAMLDSNLYLCGDCIDAFEDEMLKNGEKIHNYKFNTFGRINKIVSVKDLNINEITDTMVNALPWHFVSDLMKAQKTGNYDKLLEDYSFHISYPSAKEVERA